jgi:hypothetical protein
VSNSKKYKIHSKGGFLSFPSEIVAFKEGMFEFNFLIQGPETQYSDPLPWKYIFSKKSSIS